MLTSKFSDELASSTGNAASVPNRACLGLDSPLERLQNRAYLHHRDLGTASRLDVIELRFPKTVLMNKLISVPVNLIIERPFMSYLNSPNKCGTYTSRARYAGKSGTVSHS